MLIFQNELDMRQYPLQCVFTNNSMTAWIRVALKSLECFRRMQDHIFVNYCFLFYANDIWPFNLAIDRQRFSRLSNQLSQNSGFLNSENLTLRKRYKFP